MKKYWFTVLILVLLTAGAGAEGNYRMAHLSFSDIERVRAAKELISEVDRKSLQETIHELEKSHNPKSDLLMKEAMAKTYRDIVKEIQVEGQSKREWLYSMVCLNMAYLQFGGGAGKATDTTSLNRLIRQKLIAYLPSHALTQKGFFYSLD